MTAVQRRGAEKAPQSFKMGESQLAGISEDFLPNQPAWQRKVLGWEDMGELASQVAEGQEVAGEGQRALAGRAGQILEGCR